MVTLNKENKNAIDVSWVKILCIQNKPNVFILYEKAFILQQNFAALRKLKIFRTALLNDSTIAS